MSNTAPPPAFDELSSVEDKLEIAQDKKATGDKSFRAGEWREALRYYHEALMFLAGLDKKGLPSIAPPKETSEDDKKAITQVDILMETVYLNQAACHLKLENYKRALWVTDKVLEKNAENTKASFRKAKALTGLGYTEKAIAILESLVSKNPDDTTFKTELAQVKVKEKEADAKSYSKFRGFLGKKPEAIKAEREGTQ